MFFFLSRQEEGLGLSRDAVRPPALRDPHFVSWGGGPVEAIIGHHANTRPVSHLHLKCFF